jgi:hypothetical protein
LKKTLNNQKKAAASTAQVSNPKELITERLFWQRKYTQLSLGFVAFYLISI